MTSVVDFLYSQTTKYEYDTRGRVTKITQPDSDGAGPAAAPVTEFEFDAVGRRTKVTDPLDRETVFTFDKEGRVKTITGADPDLTGPLTSPVVTYVYNAIGAVTTITDPLSGVTSYEYDDLQRLTKITQPDPDLTGPLTSPFITYVYNSQGKVDTITDPLGRDTSFTYNSIGLRTVVTDDAGNETTYAFNDANQVTTITGEDPDNTGPLTAPVTTYTYSTTGQVASIKDAENGTTNFTYDDAGNLLTLKDPVNNITSYAYDGMGRVTMETNELGDARSFYYDAIGRLYKQVDRNEQIRHFDYDSLNRTTKEEWFESGTPLPTLTLATTTDGGVTSEVQRVGFSDDMSFLTSGTFTLTYSGQTTSAITYNASAATVQTALEALSNVAAGDVTVTKTGDTMGAQEWTLTFGGALAETNLNQTTVDSTNVMGMGTITDTEATDTQGGTTNDEVQTVTLTNADDGTFRLAFAGETTAAIDYDATTTEVETALEELNGVNNVTVTGSVGAWIVTFGGTQSGDDLARMNGDTALITSGTEEREITFTYDTASQLLTASDPDSSYAYTYDKLGRVLTVDNDDTPGAPNVVLTSAYDAMGNRTSLSATIDTTDDFLNTYTYDALNRVTRLDQDSQAGGNEVNEKRVDFSYNVGSQYTEIARFNGLAGDAGDEVATSTYTYDTLGRLTDLEYENGNVDLFTPYDWSFDNLHRVTQFVSQDGTADYDYDKTGQLTDVDYTTQTDETYTYDANGNRTITGYTTGDNNQLTNDGTSTYVYDDEGDRTSRTNDTTDYVNEYEWDFHNRLVKVTEKDDMDTTLKVVEYTYDVFNRRIGKEVDTTSPFTMTDAVIERYILDDASGIASIDGGNVVLDFVDADGDGSGTMDLERRYLFGNAVDQVLAQENIDETTSSADRVHWHLTDNLGTVRDLAKNDGTAGEHYEYDAYGKVVAGDTSLTRYLFTSREFDEEIDLQYNRARWYDSAVGRWISEDPIGFAAGDTNISRYVGNGVTGATDPSGLFEFELGGEGGVMAIAEDGDTIGGLIDAGLIQDPGYPVPGLDSPLSPGTAVDVSAALPSTVLDSIAAQQNTLMAVIQQGNPHPEVQAASPDVTFGQAGISPIQPVADLDTGEVYGPFSGLEAFGYGNCYAFAAAMLGIELPGEVSDVMLGGTEADFGIIDAGTALKSDFLRPGVYERPAENGVVYVPNAGVTQTLVGNGEPTEVPEFGDLVLFGQPAYVHAAIVLGISQSGEIYIIQKLNEGKPIAITTIPAPYTDAATIQIFNRPRR
jgi:RHS repeat-associated protein